MRLKVYSDGASRGNPGESAIAFKIMAEDGKLLKMYSRRIGVHTNNQAEYEALISAVESVSAFSVEQVTCYLDSELVVKQLNGEYVVKDPELKTLWSKVQKLKQRFPRVVFKNVPRTDVHIEEVDGLVNRALDKS